MGGQKKPTISKLKKMLEGKRKKSDKEETRKVEYGVLIDPQKREELLNYINGLRYVTPNMVSRKGEIKISVAKKFLRELEREGVVKLDIKNRELEIYIPLRS